MIQYCLNVLPEPLLSHPEPFYCPPERSEGSPPLVFHELLFSHPEPSGEGSPLQFCRGSICSPKFFALTSIGEDFLSQL